MRLHVVGNACCPRRQPQLQLQQLQRRRPRRKRAGPSEHHLQLHGQPGGGEQWWFVGGESRPTHGLHQPLSDGAAEWDGGDYGRMESGGEWPMVRQLDARTQQQPLLTDVCKKQPLRKGSADVVGGIGPRLRNG